MENKDLSCASLADYMLSATIACDLDLVIKLSKQGANNHAKCLSTAKKILFAEVDKIREGMRSLSAAQVHSLGQIIQYLNETIHKMRVKR
jgi:hypothetical protein